MELYDAMRGAFSAREFTEEPIPDAAVYKILDNARFAPSGGNRQGWRVIVIRDPETRRTLAQLAEPAAKRYAAEKAAGENPWNTVIPSSVSPETIERTPAPAQLMKHYTGAAVVLVVCVDLSVVASIDRYLARVGVVSGAGVYPFAWNILLAARNEGYGGVITTLPIAEEGKLRELLAIPARFAVAAIIPLGRPAKSITKLRRNPVSSFTTLERWDGEALESVE
ncbi:MAG: nitroreductase family protein [Deltaproteobacteria bacterium]